MARNVPVMADILLDLDALDAVASQLPDEQPAGIIVAAGVDLDALDALALRCLSSAML